MSWVGFELTTPVFKQAKAVHALDHAATVVGIYYLLQVILMLFLHDCKMTRWQQPKNDIQRKIYHHLDPSRWPRGTL
jgi:hypothetical protein